jgi:hypothetical protein
LIMQQSLHYSLAVVLVSLHILPANNSDVVHAYKVSLDTQLIIKIKMVISGRFK